MAINGSLIAFIPVRGGSKGIPGKNIRSFCGMPLVWWAVKAAIECPEIEHVYVSTDSDRITEVVEGFGLEKVSVVRRSAATASDEASTESAMLEFSEGADFGDIVLIQATSPLLEDGHLEKGISLYRSSGADACLSVVRQKRFVWQESGGQAVPVNYDPRRRPRRQEWDGYLVENGAFYITSRKKLLSSGSRVSGRVVACEMPEDSFFEIDEVSDWLILEEIKYRQLVERRLKATTGIRLLVCDVDGVLTDGGMYYSDDGSELKKFNTRDGMGLSLLMDSGVRTMLLTSEDNGLVRRRAEKLRFDHVAMGIKDKEAYLDGFFGKNSGFSWQTTAYIGDDVNDIPAMRRVAFSLAPRDAAREVAMITDYVCRLPGGGGCVREACEILLRSR